jgi:hypothetical protein
MANNLFALTGSAGEPNLKRVRVSAEVQNQLAGLFVAYDAAFREGVDEEIQFTRDWKPDDDQLLTLPASPEVQQVLDQINAGPLGLEEVNPGAFDQQAIRALLFCPEDNANGPVYFQYFYAQQRLSRRALTLVVDGDTFTRLDGPAFAIGSKIDGVIEGGVVKFKSFNILKRVFDFLANYTAASDEQIAEFAALPVLHVEDVDALIGITNQTSRKLISAVAQSGILDRVPVNNIVQQAAEFGINLITADGKIILPTDKSELKNLLRFLDNGLYVSPLEQQRFVANSKRPLGI